jgi:hypothetical protein
MIRVGVSNVPMQGKEGFVPLFAATDRKKEANGTNKRFLYSGKVIQSKRKK